MKQPQSTRVVWNIVKLKAMLLRGTFRRGGAETLGIVLAFVLTAAGATLLALFTVVVGRRSPETARPVVVVVMALAPFLAMVFGAVLGSEGSVDPRKLSPMPIRPITLGVGVLAAGTVGVGGVGFGLLGIGALAGFAPIGPSVAISVLAVVTEMIALLVLARTVANVLGIMASGRLERFANVLVALTGLATAAFSQGIAQVVDKPTSWWLSISQDLSWLPTARLALAATHRPDNAGSAIIDLGVGIVFVAALVVVHSWTFSRFLVILPGGASTNGAIGTRRGHRQRSMTTRRFNSPVASVVRRSMIAKIRHPRQLTNFVAALGLGLGGVLGIIVFAQNGVPATSVMFGGTVQFLVLFDNQNCFGMDGRALGLDLLTVAPSTIVRGKRVAAFLVGSIPALIVPVLLAIYSGGWRYVPVAWLLGAGSALAASGVAVLLGAMVPVGMPESSNPFATADAGQGCLASIGFIVSLGTLSLMTGVAWWFLMRAETNGMAVLVATALAIFVVGAGGGHLAERAAAKWIGGHVPELFAAVSPRD